MGEAGPRGPAPAPPGLGRARAGPRHLRGATARGRGRPAGRDLHRRTPVPSLAPAGASRLAPARPGQSRPGIALATG